MGCELDTLVIGDCLLRKSAQDKSLAVDYKNQFELD
jgi:carbamoyltransferase